MKTVKDVLDEKGMLSLTNVAGSRNGADDPNVKTIKYFEAQYILARLLNENNAIRMNYKKTEPNANVSLIMTDKEKEIGEVFTNLLLNQDLGVDLTTNNYSLAPNSNNDKEYNNFKRILVTALERTNAGIGPNFLANLDSKIESYVNEFEVITGVSSYRDNELDNDLLEMDKGGGYFDGYSKRVLPLSPFDPQYSNNDVFMQHGGHILYANINEYNGDILKQNEENIMLGFENAPIDSETFNHIAWNKLWDGKIEQAGRLSKFEDRIGLTPIQKDIKKIKTVKDVLDEKGMLSLTNVAGSRNGADDPNVKTIKYFEAQYILARLLNENNAIRMNYKKTEPNANVSLIMTDKEKEIGEVFTNLLLNQDLGVDLTTNNYSLAPNSNNDKEYNNFKRILVTALERTNAGIGPNFLANLDSKIESYVNEFEVITGVSSYRDNELDNDLLEMDKGGGYFDGYSKRVLPLSPFDPQYSNNDVFMQHGGHILYANINEYNGDILKQNEENIMLGFENAPIDSETFNHIAWNKLWDGKIEQAGRLSKFEDRIGLTPILAYASSDEERMSLMNAFGTRDEYGKWESNLKYDGAPDKIPDTACEKAINILNFLRENGVSYTLEKDVKAGQIKAKINDTSLNVRLVDLSANAMSKVVVNGKPLEKYNYVGRVEDFATGKQYYVRHEKNGDITTHFINNRTNQPVEVKGLDNLEVAPICYAMGLKMPNDVEFNTTRAEEGINSIQNGAFKDSVNKVGDTATISIGKDAKYYVTAKSSNLNVYRNKSEAAEKESIYSSINTNDFFENAINSARRNFELSLNFDGLKNIAEVYNNENKTLNAYGEESDILPKFSDDESIAETQRIYWDVLTGKETTILKPGIKPEDFNKDRNSYIKLFTKQNRTEAEEEQMDELKYKLDSMSYEVKEDTIDEYGRVTPGLSAEEAVQKHIKDLIEYEIGNLDLDENDKSFNPQNVLKFMDSTIANTYTREDVFAHYLGNLDYSLNQYKGNENANSQILVRSVKFDESNAESLANLANSSNSEVYKNAYNAVINAVKNVPNVYFAHEGELNANDIDIQIDKNGIIKYEIERIVGSNSSNSETEKVTGYVGQIFDYDEHAKANGWEVVKTKFNGPKNYSFIPDKKAKILPNKPGEDKPFPERLRVDTYEKQIYNMVYNTVLNDVLNRDAKYTQIGKTYSVNKLYYGMDADHMPYNYEEVYKAQGLSDEDINTKMMLRTTSIKLDNSIRDESESFTEFKEMNKDYDEGADNNNYHSTFIDCDKKNRNIIDKDCAGYFDLYVTASAANQGLKLYLAKGASIDEEGHIHYAKNPDNSINRDARCLLMDNEYFKNSTHNAADRVIMASNNFLDATEVAKNIGFVQMSFGGWGFDDGFVISKKFAETFKVRNISEVANEDGKMEIKIDERDRVIGDKMSDMSGNKGVIAAIIDPDEPNAEIHLQNALEKQKQTEATYNEISNQLKEQFDINVKFGENLDIEEYTSYTENIDALKELTDKLKDADKANRQALKDINHYQTVLFMRDNPNVDVIEAPYSHTSRQNGGTAMDAMQSAFDVIVRDENGNQQVLHNMGGRSNFNMLPQTADNKTHIYTGASISEGRKASSQLAWALTSQGAYQVMNEFYGDNETGFKDFREYANTFGVNVTDTADIEVGYETALLSGSPKYVFELPTLRNEDLDSMSNVSLSEYENKFQMDLEQHGGFLELPFPLNFESKIGKNGDGSPINYQTPELHEFINQHENDAETSWIVEKYKDNLPNHPVYLMPIMSPKCRASTELYDGNIVTHDYTTYYRAIFQKAIEYNNAEMKLAADKKQTYYDSEHNLTKNGEKFKKEYITGRQEAAQNNLSKLARRVAADKFNTKENIMKLSIMTKRRPDSATSIWSCNPYLPIDTISMSTETAKKLKLTVGGKGPDKNELSGNGVILWRDPILHDGNVRYMNVEINEDLVGIQINGAMDKSFDGDFDGDTIALVPLKTAEANEEAREKLSVKANLLNKNAAPQDMIVYNEDGTPYLDSEGNTVTFKGLPLMMNDGMDLAAGEGTVVEYHGNKVTLAEKRKILESQVNMVKMGYLTPEQFVTGLKIENTLKQFEQAKRQMEATSEKSPDYEAKKANYEKLYKTALPLQRVRNELEKTEALYETLKEGKKIINGYAKKANIYYDVKSGKVEGDVELAYSRMMDYVRTHYSELTKLKSMCVNDIKADKQSVSTAYLSHWINEQALPNAKAERQNLYAQLHKSPAEELSLKTDAYVSELSEYTAEAFGKGFKKHIVSFNSVKDHLSSVIDYMNDGAKAGGKPDKLADYCKALGVEIVDDLKTMVNDAKQIRNDFVMKLAGSDKIAYDFDPSEIKQSGFTDQDRHDSQLAGDVKKKATGLSGSISQNGMASFRRDNPEAVLETTYAVTQAVLQVKHDPKDAQRKFTYLNGLVRKLWQGSEIAKYDASGNVISYDRVGEVSGEWKVVKNPYFGKNKEKPNLFYMNRENKRVTPEQYVNMFMAFYSDKEGLGVEPNKEYVELLTGLMTVPATEKYPAYVGGIKNADTSAQGVTFMDTLAYNKGGTLSSIVNKIQQYAGTCMFGNLTDKATMAFAPNSIYNNIKNGLAEAKEKLMEKIDSTTSMEEYKNTYANSEKIMPMTAYQLGLKENLIKEILPENNRADYNKTSYKKSMVQSVKGVETAKQQYQEKHSQSSGFKMA